MLEILGLSRSGYYDYFKRKNIVTPTKKRKIELTEKIKEIHEHNYCIYGAPKITKILQRNGIKVSEKYVGNIMRENGIKARYIKPYIVTTISKDYTNKLKNILDREFSPTSPDASWCTDITYIWTKNDGFVYLTSVMDLFSRKIISWVLTRTMEAEDVLKCIAIAKRKRNISKPLVIQSDRGIQFTSDLYNKLTENMIRSYSHKGTPWDNACIESFHALIKREWLQFYEINDYTQAYRIIFEYIEGFYNTMRIHSHCDYYSPNYLENHYRMSA